MAPSVMPGPQVRWSRSAILLQGGRNFRHSQARMNAAHDHLARELHTGSSQVEPAHGLGVKAAQPAMEIPYLGPEEEAANEAQDRVAETAVEKRHGAGFYSAREAVTTTSP